jgi:protein ATS1
MSRLLVSGSNASSHLSLAHSQDVSTFQPVIFHPSITDLLGTKYQILDITSASTHTLLLVRPTDGPNIVLGAGVNGLGQLGPRCALWDEVKPESRAKIVDMLGPLGMDHTDWIPVKIASSWTTSFVVYNKVCP